MGKRAGKFRGFLRARYLPVSQSFVCFCSRSLQRIFVTPAVLFRAFFLVCRVPAVSLASKLKCSWCTLSWLLATSAVVWLRAWCHAPLNGYSGILTVTHRSRLKVALRFCCCYRDELGIIERIGKLAAANGVSIRAILQNEIKDVTNISFVVMTDPCK